MRPTQYDLHCSTVLRAPMAPSHLAAGSVLKWSYTSLELIYVMYGIGWQNAAAWQIMNERSDVCCSISGVPSYWLLTHTILFNNEQITGTRRNSILAEIESIFKYRVHMSFACCSCEINTFLTWSAFHVVLIALFRPNEMFKTDQSRLSLQIFME